MVSQDKFKWTDIIHHPLLHLHSIYPFFPLHPYFREEMKDDEEITEDKGVRDGGIKKEGDEKKIEDNGETDEEDINKSCHSCCYQPQRIEKSKEKLNKIHKSMMKRKDFIDFFHAPFFHPLFHFYRYHFLSTLHTNSDLFDYKSFFKHLPSHNTSIKYPSNHITPSSKPQLFLNSDTRCFSQAFSPLLSPSHTNPTRFHCEACNKSYSTYNGLFKHKELHCTTLSRRCFSCPHCHQKTYATLGALKMHIRTHTLPCKCKYCGKAFSRPWLLRGHLRTHTGEKPFICAHCSRAFADKSNLRAHLQTHSTLKKHHCVTCDRHFSRLSLYLKHKNTCL